VELYGVSRSVVREALSYLENTGVIRTRQGQGAFLNETNMSHLLENFFFLWEINGGNIAEIQSLRLIFESAAIDEICKENRDLTLLKLAIKKGETANTGEACRDADKAFHVALLEATGNNLFIQMSHVITQYFFASTHIQLSPEENKQAMCEHQKILNAMETKDADEAKAILTQHIQKIKS
jgi:GntR family transcriptional repressor for pyruvate dehydrogenase complex